MAKLTTEERNALPDSDFALPGRRYPLPNEDHARAALADMQKDTSLSEKDRRHIRAMVHYRFPDIEIAK